MLGQRYLLELLYVIIISIGITTTYRLSSLCENDYLENSQVVIIYTQNMEIFIGDVNINLLEK